MNKLSYLFNLFTGRFWIRWRRLNLGLYVVTYHRIGDKRTTEFDPNVFSCDSSTFEKHLCFYKKHFDVITPNQVIEKQATTHSKPLLCITFDDGYLDNYEVALPLLQKYCLVATFFITSNYIKQQQIPWWDEISWMLRATQRSNIRLSWENGRNFVVADINSNSYCLHQFMTAVKRHAEMSMPQKIKKLQQLLDIKFDINQLKKPLFMNEDNVRSMANAGMEIGGHTMNHPILSHLGLTQQATEINQNKQHLESVINQPISAFAYPVGGYHCYQQATIDILKRAGYQLGFTYENGVNQSCRQGNYELLRFPIEMNDSIHRLKYMMTFPKSTYHNGQLI